MHAGATWLRDHRSTVAGDHMYHDCVITDMVVTYRLRDHIVSEHRIMTYHRKPSIRCVKTNF